jgi:curli biogenesis system outer membrane secretion channel CsgG
MIKILLLTATILLFGGCATKLQVQSVKPANVNLNNTKNIAVLSFKNDKHNLSGDIEAILNSSYINKKKYFNVVDRKNLSTVLREQKLQSSGVINENTVVDIGNISGVEAIITGVVSKPTNNTRRYTSNRRKCKKDADGKKVCYDVRTYCTEARTNIDLHIKVVSTSNANILFSKKYNGGTSNTECGSRYLYNIDFSNMERKLLKSAANNFAYQLVPHTYYRSIELMEDLEKDYNDEAEQLLESSIDYLKNRRMDKSKALTKRLIDVTNRQSFVPFYNLAIIEESNGDYTKALKLIKKADSLNIKQNDLIDNAIYRIEKEIKEQQNINDIMNKKGL